MTDNVDVKELLIKAQGLLKGHFCLTSGLHSDTYFQCAKLYQYPDIVETLAKELGVSDIAIGRWEKGLRTPNIDTLILVANYFNVSADYLLGLKDY